jgi:hypothetical protein
LLFVTFCKWRFNYYYSFILSKVSQCIYNLMSWSNSVILLWIFIFRLIFRCRFLAFITMCHLLCTDVDQVLLRRCVYLLTSQYEFNNNWCRVFMVSFIKLYLNKFYLIHECWRVQRVICEPFLNAIIFSPVLVAHTGCFLYVLDLGVHLTVIS